MSLEKSEENFRKRPSVAAAGVDPRRDGCAVPHADAVPRPTERQLPDSAHHAGHGGSSWCEPRVVVPRSVGQH